MLLFAGWQTVGYLSRAPAFNASLLVEAPEGRRIPQHLHAFYDRATYSYWIARLWNDRYRYAAFDAAQATSDSAESAAIAAEALDRSRENVRASLAQRPGDPSTWILVAKTELGLGNRAAALSAYRNSYELARYNAVLAAERVQVLIAVMEEPEGVELALARVDPEAVRGDLETMRVRFGPLTDSYAERPGIATLLESKSAGT